MRIHRSQLSPAVPCRSGHPLLPSTSSDPSFQFTLQSAISLRSSRPSSPFHGQRHSLVSGATAGIAASCSCCVRGRPHSRRAPLCSAMCVNLRTSADRSGNSHRRPSQLLILFSASLCSTHIACGLTVSHYAVIQPIDTFDSRRICDGTIPTDATGATSQRGNMTANGRRWCGCLASGERTDSRPHAHERCASPLLVDPTRFAHGRRTEAA